MQNTFDALGMTKEIPKSTPTGLWNLVCLCAMTDPTQRPQFSEIYECLEVVKEKLQVREELDGKQKKIKNSKGDETDESADDSSSHSEKDGGEGKGSSSP